MTSRDPVFPLMAELMTAALVVKHSEMCGPTISQIAAASGALVTKYHLHRMAGALRALQARRQACPTCPTPSCTAFSDPCAWWWRSGRYTMKFEPKDTHGR